MKYIEATNLKYEKMHRLALQTIAEQSMKNKECLRCALKATPSEIESLFKRFPDMKGAWANREKPKSERKRRRKRSTRGKDGLLDDVRAAREAGLTYGQWRALQDTKKETADSESRYQPPLKGY